MTIFNETKRVSSTELKTKVSEKFNTETKKVVFVAVCAFGVICTCYLEDKDSGYRDYKFDNKVAEIHYAKSDSKL